MKKLPESIAWPAVLTQIEASGTSRFPIHIPLMKIIVGTGTKRVLTEPEVYSDVVEESGYCHLPRQADLTAGCKRMSLLNLA